MSGEVPMVTKDLQTYKCKWRTHSNIDTRADGEIDVAARDLTHAIAVAKQKLYEQTGIGINNLVVYEVEEPFL